MTRVAAVDCGTNSIRLLVADRHDGELSYIERRSEIVRLGQGVDVTGRIADEAMARTLNVARSYAELCRALNVESIRFVATSASRDAQNAAEFVSGVSGAFAGYDVVPEVVTGLEEAQLSFVGATGGLQAGSAPAPYLVVDLGGGSTELVRGFASVEEAISLDIGSVRLTERHFAAADAVRGREAAITAIDAALDEAESAVNLTGLGSLVGLAGSITTVTAHALGLTAYDSARIHGAVLPVETVLASCAAIYEAPRHELQAMPFMHPGRVDVIAAGALIWSRLVMRVRDRSGLDVVRTSEADILDGIALSITV